MNTYSFRLIVFLLIFSPLAFGTVDLWSYAIMEGVALIALFVVMIGKEAKEKWVEVPGFLPLTLFLAYILLQLIPLPPMLVNIISPATARLYSETVGLLDSDAWMSLSVNRKETVSEFFRFSAYAALYVATIQLFSYKVFFKRIVYIIAGFASVFALFAILQHFTSNHQMLWSSALPGKGFFGTYVNRNHYAGFMGMLLPVLVSFFLFMRPAVFYTTFRERIVEFFGDFRSNIYLLMGFSCILAATSVFLCLSRGGIVSMCIALSILGILLALRGKNKKQGITLSLLFLLILFSVGGFGWTPIFDRFKSIRDADGEIHEARLQIWQDSIKIIADFPITGTGFGTFNSLFPTYRSFPYRATFAHSHNDYIELATDGGVVALVLVGWFLSAVFYRSIQSARKRRDLFSIYLFAGSLTGLLTILIHSITDFNLHIGANGLYFFLLLSLMVSAAHTRARGERPQSLLKKKPFFPVRWASVFTGVIACGALVFNLGAHAGTLYLSPLWGKLLAETLTQQELDTMYRGLEMAIRLDPLESQYPLLMANTMIRDDAKKDAARVFFETAVRLNPSNGLFLRELALFHSRSQKESISAEKLFVFAIKYNGSDPEGYKEYGLWLLEQGRLEEGFLQIRKAIELAPSKTKSYIALLVKEKWALTDIPKVLPDLVPPYLFYADYLLSAGESALAETAFTKAIDNIANEATVKAEWFYPVYKFYEKAGQLDAALGIMLKAIEYLPENAGLHMTVASLYEKLGIIYRAQEEYNRVLFLDPNNKAAKKRLSKLSEG